MDFDTEDEIFLPAAPDPPETPGPDYSSSVPMAGLPLAGAMMGLCLGGPVGVLAGVKLGGVAAVGGSILGYTGARVIEEQKDMRRHIDDHYKNEPRLYVLTPREEALLAKRRTSSTLRPIQSDLATTTPRQLPSVRRHASSSESPRHLPSVRTRRACYRSSRTLSEQRHYSSANSSPVTSRRRLDSSPRHQPPHLQHRQFRRLGDLSAEDQRSVIALIRGGAGDPGDNFQRSPRPRTRRRLPTTDGSSHLGSQLHTAESRRKQFARQQSRRASSLPDVLEEETFSNKS